MKNSKIIIYDDNCPLCAAYTRVFVSAGMIEKENRLNFTTIDPAILNLIDRKRCSNEIPVIDSSTKEVWYGIDGMVKILETKVPWIKSMIQFKFIKVMLNELYKLISYNRRVIVATRNSAGNFDCTPDFNYKYRLMFMLFFMLFNTAMLMPIHTYILNNSSITITSGQLQLAHTLLVILNMIIASSLKLKSAFEYLGQVNMLALTTVLITIPLIVVNKFNLLTSPVINNLYLMILTLFVFKEYWRRMTFAEIPGKQPFIVVINVLALCCFIGYLLH